MIEIKAGLRHNRIQSISIEGHALFAPSGQDLVCAGVSAIAFGLLNGLDQVFADQCDLFLDEQSGIYIRVLQNTEALQKCLEVALISFETVAEAYPDFVQIKKITE